MFDLQFISRPETDDEGRVYMRGAITLGDWREEFLAPLGPWTMADYTLAWLAAAERLVAGAPRVGFLHHFAHLDAEYHFYWQAWREGQRVYFQEGLLLTEQLAAAFRPDSLDVHVKARTEVTQDGERVSQWQVDLEDIVAYVERRRPSPVPA